MKLMFFGDVLFDREMKFSEELIFLCDEHDFCISNLEGIFRGPGQRIVKAGRWIESDEKYSESFLKHFNVVTLANNHTMDYGEGSLLYTLSFLEENNVRFCGAGRDNEEAHKPLDLGGVFLMSVSENEFGAATPSSSGIASYDDMRILYKNIQECKDKGKVIVCYHGGSECIPIPQEYIRERFKLLSDFGADVVIGTHPHVVQGFEDNLFYSLGNFFFQAEGVDFSPYKNSDWSLVVSYDTETTKLKTYCISLSGNELTVDETRREELNFLCSLLGSDEYKSMSDMISCILHSLWYPEYYHGGDMPGILHHFRCDAHKNNIVMGISRIIGEHLPELKDYRIELNGESIAIHKKEV